MSHNAAGPAVDAGDEPSEAGIGGEEDDELAAGHQGQVLLPAVGLADVPGELAILLVLGPR